MDDAETSPLDLEEVYANLPWAYPVNRDEPQT
jgi:hypothetical protein